MGSETRKAKPKETAPAEVAKATPEPKPVSNRLINTLKAVQANRRHPIKVKADPDMKNCLSVQQERAELHAGLYETTGFTDIDAAMLLVIQIAQTSEGEKYEDLTNAGLAMMNGIAPENPLEGLLAAQMTVAHNMAMQFAGRAMREGQTTEGIDQNINRATKLLRAFTTQAEMLHKLRNKGQQKIIVQHVQVNEGGQAVIGDVNQGGVTGA